MAGKKQSDMATEKIEFASVEQGFQYIKTYFSGGDADTLDVLRGHILATTDGASLRRLGREVPALDRESWDREAPGIMHDLVLESFRANPKAAVELLATGDAIITHEQDGSRWREEFPKILMQVREELRNPERGPDRGVSYYAGNIEPGGNVVFVFGSNPEGRHGAGAARVAASKFGAVKGVGEGLQGSSYALPTKDLRVTRNHGYRSISEVDIMENIRRMYECAEQNPERRFMVAYTNAPDERTLNGYTGAEMAAMFVGADGGRIPSNVVFSDAWREEMDRQLASLDAANNHAVEVHAAAGEQADDMKYDELKSAFCRFWDDNLKVTKDFNGFYENMVASFRETQGQAFGKEGYARAERFVSEMEKDLELMDYLTRSLNYSAATSEKDNPQGIRFEESEGGYAQRTRENAAAPDVHFTVAFARDFSTYGEKCTAMAAGDSLIQIELPYTRTGHISLSEDSVMKGAETLLSMLPDEFFSSKDVQPSGWNIAGNGIYTLGTPQSEIDEYVTKVFAVAMDRGLNPVSFRSGGQTGVDEAGAVAGQVLGIPTVVHAPKGFKMRNAEGRDICGRDAFTQRFRDKDYAGLRKSVDALVQDLHRERKNKASMKFGI